MFTSLIKLGVDFSAIIDKMFESAIIHKPAVYIAELLVYSEQTIFCVLQLFCVWT